MFTKCQVVKECVRAQMWWTGNSVTVHHKHGGSVCGQRLV